MPLAPEFFPKATRPGEPLSDTRLAPGVDLGSAAPPQMLPMVHHKRSNRLVSKRLQLKLLIVFLGISCFAVFVQMALLTQTLLGVGHKLPQGEQAIHAAVPSVLGMNLVITGCFVLPIMLLIGLRMTMRVAGPAYRINRYLQGLIHTGTAQEPCQIRKDDELQGLVAALNAAVNRIERDRTQGKTDTSVGQVA